MNIWQLKRKVHSCWLVAFVCGGFLIGVLVSKYYSQVDGLIFALLASVIIIAGFVVRRVWAIPLVILGGLLFGLWRGGLLVNGLDQYGSLYNHTVEISGRLTDDPDIDTSNQMVLRLGDINFKGHKMAGLLWATVGENNIERGDTIVVNGQLQPGFGNFAGVIYRGEVKKITKPDPPDLALELRNWFADGIRRVIGEPESSLGIGFLVGQRRALPASLVSALQIVGLTHVVVASGYNLTILVRLSRRLFAKVSKYLSMITSLAMVFGFIAITGASPSMVRAGWVSVLSLLAWYYGREFHPIILLLFTMMATVAMNPTYLWGDLGWQLSFASFAGVMILAPFLQKYLWGDNKPSTIGQIVVETLSAQVMTMPIIVLAFGQFSNIALLANILILPFVPLAMLSTFVAGVAGLIGGLAGFLAWPAQFLLGYMVKVIDMLADLPWACSEVKINSSVVGLFYVGAGILCMVLYKLTKYRLREVNIIE